MCYSRKRLTFYQAVIWLEEEPLNCNGSFAVAYIYGLLRCHGDLALVMPLALFDVSAAFDTRDDHKILITHSGVRILRVYLPGMATILPWLNGVCRGSDCMLGLAPVLLSVPQLRPWADPLHSVHSSSDPIYQKKLHLMLSSVNPSKYFILKILRQ